MAVQRVSDRAFGLAIGGLFALLAAIGFILSGGVPTWAVAVSAGFLLSAIVMPGLLMPLNRIWTRIGGAIGAAVNFLLLGAFFYLVISPFGLLRRAFGVDSIIKRPLQDAESYWQPVRRQASPETYSDLF